MSGIPAVPLQMMGLETPHWFDAFLNSFNTSPYFIGIMMLTMNLGSRFLSLEMSKGQEAFFSHPWIRRFLIFVVFFIGTRNIWVAFWLAFTAILLLGYLFNENSSLCLFKGGLPGAACTKPGAAVLPTAATAAAAAPSASALTQEEMNIYKQLHEKHMRGQQQQAPAALVKEETPDLYSIYKKNMDSVKKIFN